MQGKDLRQNRLLAVVLDDGVAQAHFDFLIYLVAHALDNIVPRQVVALHGAKDAQ